MANKKKSSQSLKTSTKSRSKNGVMGNQISKAKKSTQSDFGANYEKNTTMCFPWIKVAWLQYLSVAEVLEKEAFSVTDATRTRKRKRKVGQCHTCKRPMKGHSRIKDCPRNMAKQSWIQTVFFLPTLTDVYFLFTDKFDISINIHVNSLVLCLGALFFKLYYFPGVA